MFGSRRCLWLSISMLVALAISAGSLRASVRRWAKAMRSAKVAYEQADFTTAKRQLAVAVEQAAKFDMGDPRAVQTLNALANLYRAEGRLDWAETVLGRARAMAEVWLGPESPELATTLNNLGALHTNEQKFSEAEEPLSGPWPCASNSWDRSIPRSLRNLGEALLNPYRPRYAEAESLLKRSLEIDQKALGPEHPAVATTLDDLAALYTAEGRYAEAEPLERKALEIFEHTLPSDHPYVADGLQPYAALLRKMNRQAEADTLEARAFTIAASRSQSKGGDP